MSLSSINPLEKIVFIQRVLKFAIKNPKHICTFAFVSQEFQSALIDYDTAQQILFQKILPFRRNIAANALTPEFLVQKKYESLLDKTLWNRCFSSLTAKLYPEEIALFNNRKKLHDEKNTSSSSDSQTSPASASPDYAEVFRNNMTQLTILLQVMIEVHKCTNLSESLVVVGDTIGVRGSDFWVGSAHSENSCLAPGMRLVWKSFDAIISRLLRFASSSSEQNSTFFILLQTFFDAFIRFFTNEKVWKENPVCLVLLFGLPWSLWKRSVISNQNDNDGKVFDLFVNKFQKTMFRQSFPDLPQNASHALQKDYTGVTRQLFGLLEIPLIRVEDKATIMPMDRQFLPNFRTIFLNLECAIKQRRGFNIIEQLLEPHICVDDPDRRSSDNKGIIVPPNAYSREDVSKKSHLSSRLNERYCAARREVILKAVEICIKENNVELLLFFIKLLCFAYGIVLQPPSKYNPRNNDRAPPLPLKVIYDHKLPENNDFIEFFFSIYTRVFDLGKSDTHEYFAPLFHHCVKRNHVAMCRFLVEEAKVVFPTSTWKTSITPSKNFFFIAIEYGSLDVVEYFLEYLHSVQKEHGKFGTETEARRFISELETQHNFRHYNDYDRYGCGTKKTATASRGFVGRDVKISYAVLGLCPLHTCVRMAINGAKMIDAIENQATRKSKNSAARRKHQNTFYPIPSCAWKWDLQRSRWILNKTEKEKSSSTSNNSKDETTVSEQPNSAVADTVAANIATLLLRHVRKEQQLRTTIPLIIYVHSPADLLALKSLRRKSLHFEFSSFVSNATFHEQAQTVCSYWTKLEIGKYFGCYPKLVDVIMSSEWNA